MIWRKEKLVEEGEGGGWLVLVGKGAVEGNKENDDELYFGSRVRSRRQASELLILSLPKAIGQEDDSAEFACLV